MSQPQPAQAAAARYARLDAERDARRLEHLQHAAATEQFARDFVAFVESLPPGDDGAQLAEATLDESPDAGEAVAVAVYIRPGSTAPGNPSRTPAQAQAKKQRRDARRRQRQGRRK